MICLLFCRVEMEGSLLIAFSILDKKEVNKERYDYYCLIFKRNVNYILEKLCLDNHIINQQRNVMFDVVFRKLVDYSVETMDTEDDYDEPSFHVCVKFLYDMFANDDNFHTMDYVEEVFDTALFGI